jgi:ATP-dependent NAD(P)H-hydrate dehydratase
VIGGSIDYTGAPYYSGIAALRSGADIAHVFCPSDASGPIKGYSPELIVHPCLDDSNEIIKWIGSSVTSLVIGPGLGRSE